MGNKVVDHRFGSPLREPLVVFCRTLVVTVGRKLYGDVGIFIEQFHEPVECRAAAVTQSGLVEIVEDVVDKGRGRDVSQGELQGGIP